MPKRLTPTRIAFIVTAIGTMLVALAALTEYIGVTTRPTELLDAKIIAKRFVITFLLVLVSFELALFLLHRFIRHQERIIENQREQLKRYSKRLEELVGDQYERIKRIMTQFQAITGNLPVILWAVDRRGEIKFAEGSGLSIIGLSGKKIMGKRVEDVFGEGTTVSSHVTFALSGEQISATDHMKNGWFASRYAPIKDQDGTIAGAIMVAVDVTDEFHLSKRADAAREHCRNLTNYVMSPVIIMTAEGVSLVNKSAADIIGRTAKELSQATPEDILSAETLKIVSEKIRPNKPTLGMEVGLQGADGKKVPVIADVFVTQMNSHREIMLVVKQQAKKKKSATTVTKEKAPAAKKSTRKKKTPAKKPTVKK